jgi:hypothetical protein
VALCNPLQHTLIEDDILRLKGCMLPLQILNTWRNFHYRVNLFDPVRRLICGS